MTRIRYRKKDNTLTSSKPIVCNNKLVDVSINFTSMTYQIVDVVSKETVYSGVSSTVNNLKKDAKNILIKLGASFYNEVRNTNGKESKLIIEDMKP